MHFVVIAVNFFIRFVIVKCFAFFISDRSICDLNPCRHGYCLPNQSEPLGYNCFCSNGYTGYNCQTNYNECRLEICQNNSTCVDEIAEAKCECLPGYSGKKCEIEINECLSNPCIHGKCIDKVDKYLCECDYGYSGLNCEIDETVCNETMANETTVCQHGGICIEESGYNFSCLCKKGYKGKYCESLIDYCQPVNPCSNGGECKSLIGDFSCNCPFGWTGKKCEVQLRLCSVNSCQNHGLCLTKVIQDELKHRSCYCVPGFHGQFCEHRFNECIPSNNCLNGGSCVSGVDNYTCFCKESFRGVFCEIDCRKSTSELCIDASTISYLPSETLIQSSFDTVMSCSNEYCLTSFTTPLQTPVISITETPIESITATPSLVVSDYIPLSTAIYNDTKPSPEKLFSPKFNGITSVLTIDKDIYDSTEELWVQFSFKTDKSDSYLLYSQNQFSPGDFFVLFLQNGQLKLGLSCQRKMIIIENNLKLDDGSVHSVEMRLSLSPDKKTCYAELKVNESEVLFNNASMNIPITGLCFKHLHFGREPSRVIYSPFNGCLFNIFINGRQVFVTQQMKQQDLSECIESGGLCDHEPCKNGAACIELVDNWFCNCVVGFKGHFCEEATCELNPCRNDGFCVLQNSTYYKCICQRGWYGDNCEFEFNVNHPSFAGNEKISYLTYSMSQFVSGEHLELRLRLITQNVRQQAAIIAFMGQDYQYTSEYSDDFLSISLHKGYLVYRINLGYGTKILTAALKANNSIETVYFGHHRQFVWLVTKDDVQYASRVPRKYRALNVTPDLYIGGHKNISQYTALRNHTSFKGCIFNVEARFDPRANFERLDYVIDSRNVNDCRELRLCKRSLQLCT